MPLGARVRSNLWKVTVAWRVRSRWRSLSSGDRPSVERSRQ